MTQPPAKPAQALTRKDIFDAYFGTSNKKLEPMTNERADAIAEKLNAALSRDRQGEALTEQQVMDIHSIIGRWTTDVVDYAGAVDDVNAYLFGGIEQPEKAALEHSQGGAQPTPHSSDLPGFDAWWIQDSTTNDDYEDFAMNELARLAGIAKRAYQAGLAARAAEAGGRVWCLQCGKWIGADAQAGELKRLREALGKLSERLRKESTGAHGASCETEAVMSAKAAIRKEINKALAKVDQPSATGGD